MQSGTRFGAYEVIAPLGEGGMGQVWLARDTMLEREDLCLVMEPADAVEAPPQKLVVLSDWAAQLLGHSRER